MDRGPARHLVREIAALYTSGSLVGLSDAELLERFLARAGDDAEDAFAALVARHGTTVLGVCRRMLASTHDIEDAFQATFLVLARRAGSIGRRERLGCWLYGVAVRTAREARRRAARARDGERRLMDLSRVEPEPTEDRDDWLPMLDEELNRLPTMYRAALVACELEGKSRREAARQLGIPEGTLSTHLARGRKLLRDRLRRRGLTLGLGPIAPWSLPAPENAVPDRLMGTTVRVAIGPTAGAGAPLTVASLAERVLKMMFLARLTLIVAALMTAAAGAMTAVALGLAATAVEAQKPDPPRPGPDDLAGRVVDRAGAGVADVRVWGMVGVTKHQTVATATTDAQGRYVLPRVVHHIEPSSARTLNLFVRAPNGRVGWHQPGQRPDDPADVAIELLAAGDARGRLTDHDGKPLAGVVVTPLLFVRTNVDGVWLSPEVSGLFQTTTAADGSFLLKGIPQGIRLTAKLETPAFGAPTAHWDATQAVAISLDGRLVRIRGRLRPPPGLGISRSYPLVAESAARPGASPPGSIAVNVSKATKTAPDGAFEFDGLPPGRYVVNAYFQEDGIIAGRPETEVEVAPGGVATVEIALRKLPKISGRIVDAATGRGIAAAKIHALLREEGKNSNWVVGEATTDADGRYTIPARPGDILVDLSGMPEGYLLPIGAARPTRKLDADWTAPDLKLVRAAGCDGVVVDGGGRPVAGAEVYFLTADRPGGGWRREPLRTGADGTFHLDRLEADQLVALWARAGDATTRDPVVVRPRELQGKVTLTVDPRNAVRIRGQAVDSGGRRVVGARVTLWWTRWNPVEKGRQPTTATGSLFATFTTGTDGWFVFRNLWPEVDYKVVVEARGHNKAEAPELTGKAGETHDIGKVLLIGTSGHLAGRVAGTDGRPIAGASVFNRGDGPEMVGTSTDAEGRFRLEGMFPGTCYAFVRRPGYRFTGIKTVSDADGLTITLRTTDEPPLAWKPGKGPSLDEQRAFARHVLIRLWEKYGADADNNGAWPCIGHMAEIDPDLALQWSAQKGHRYDDEVRHAEARNQAETDPAGALALLNQKPTTKSQSVLQGLADRFAESDAPKALRFDEEAALQSRGLNQPDRALAMAKAGVVLVKLGRADAGGKLIDEAARDAAGLTTARWAGDCRGQVARILATQDVDRALAIIEPFRTENPDWWSSLRADIAVAIGTSDTKRAMALVDTVGGRGFNHEMARTAIAYRIGRDRPDEAIRIIEGIRRNRWASAWQAGAFGWLAVALSPRDRAQAYGLIDRALAMMIDERDWMGADGLMEVAARVAGCARRIGYPDMEGAILRVMAARPVESRGASGDRGRHVQHLLDAAVPLALIDPDAARPVLMQVEARCGFDPVTLWNTRKPWLIAWALVDLKKAEAIFEADLAILDREKKEADFWGTGFYEMVDLLIAPPDRREAVLGRNSAGGYWRPEE